MSTKIIIHIWEWYSMEVHICIIMYMILDVRGRNISVYRYLFFVLFFGYN